MTENARPVAMIEGQLIARRVNDDPPGYRVIFQDVEIGSISVRNNHVEQRDYWHWGVDTKPLLGGGTEPRGRCDSFGEALAAFRGEFFRWVNGLHPGDWQRNRDYKKATEARQK